MTGVLAQMGSFLHAVFGTAIAYAAETAPHAEEAGEHASGIHVVLKAEEVFRIFNFPVTNSLLMTWVTVALLIGFAFYFRNKIALVPGKLQAGVEMLFEGVLNYMTETLEDEKLARRFFPLIMTIFLFVFLANQLAFLPGIGSLLIESHGSLVPLFRAPAADLNMTLALAIISFLVIEISGVVILGFFKYAGKYVNFSSPVNFVVGIIELLSNVGRLISFSFRLFGNVFAGEVMIAVALFFVAYLLPVPLMAFEVFVGFIQAVVFAMLTLFFIKLSIMDPHESH
ncbi:F0F1 ATP synthase subunit A [Patescibacteria group bacterium]|nr:F0F1 ATP synthase subunit A [Patescibacteria group bacterium]MBU2159050.1 F0F1 ATP synthase subunit A [Patescibacteria group bacterium]MBU2220699.1 F0F1 ATP synthase subunit A [Patescibacteria group bacterium]